MSISVIGHKGRLGSALVSLLKQKTVIDEGFVSKTTDLIINCAGYVNSEWCERPGGTRLAFNANTDVQADLLRQAESLKVPIIYFSTNYVFDGRQPDSVRGYTETAPTNPLNVYGMTKLMAEHITRKYEKHYIIRTQWLFSPDMACFFSKFLTQLADPAVAQVRLVNDQVGCPTYLPAFCAAVLRLIEERPPYGTYHLSGQDRASWLTWGRDIMAECDVRKPIQELSIDAFQTCPRPKISPLNSDKARRLGIYVPGYSHFMKQVIRKT